MPQPSPRFDIIHSEISKDLERLTELETSARLTPAQRQMLDETRRSLGQVSSELEALRSEHEGLQADFEHRKKALEDDLASIRAERDGLQSDLTSIRAERDGLQSHLTNIMAERDDLQSRLEDLQGDSPRMEVNALLEQFRHDLADLNWRALHPSEAERDQPRVVIERMEVELKAGLDLAQGVQLVQLRGQEGAPENASVVRFTLRPATRIEIVEDEPGT